MKKTVFFLVAVSNMINDGNKRITKELNYLESTTSTNYSKLEAIINEELSFVRSLSVYWTKVMISFEFELVDYKTIDNKLMKTINPYQNKLVELLGKLKVN